MRARRGAGGTRVMWVVAILGVTTGCAGAGVGRQRSEVWASTCAHHLDVGGAGVSPPAPSQFDDRIERTVAAERAFVIVEPFLKVCPRVGSVKDQLVRERP